mmetsp:Transcript_20740/g.3354  ORF Transcript_20740/g.3354 Transcript_20740/m.3354 type:complete len:90 (+) Transcript_20740:427-696(+)
MILSIWHGLICYWAPLLYLDGPINETGMDIGLWVISTISFTLVIHIITLKLYIESDFLNIFNVTAGIFSVVLYYCTLLVLSEERMANMF